MDAALEQEAIGPAGGNGGQFDLELSADGPPHELALPAFERGVRLEDRGADGPVARAFTREDRGGAACAEALEDLAIGEAGKNFHGGGSRGFHFKLVEAVSRQKIRRRAGSADDQAGGALGEEIHFILVGDFLVVEVHVLDHHVAHRRGAVVAADDRRSVTGIIDGAGPADLLEPDVLDEAALIITAPHRAEDAEIEEAIVAMLDPDLFPEDAADLGVVAVVDGEDGAEAVDVEDIDVAEGDVADRIAAQFVADFHRIAGAIVHQRAVLHDDVVDILDPVKFLPGRFPGAKGFDHHAVVVVLEEASVDEHIAGAHDIDAVGGDDLADFLQVGDTHVPAGAEDHHPHRGLDHDDVLDHHILAAVEDDGPHLFLAAVVAAIEHAAAADADVPRVGGKDPAFENGAAL